MKLFGPPRTKFGKWLDKKGITQSEFGRQSGVSVKTISDLARGRTANPTRLTSKKLMKALKSIDPTVNEKQFWDL